MLSRPARLSRSRLSNQLLDGIFTGLWLSLVLLLLFATSYQT